MKMGESTHNNAPIEIVIFGATGDLANRKLIPAFFELYCKNKLPEHFSIVGLARSRRSSAEYQEFVADALEGNAKPYSKKDIRAFCTHVRYVTGLFDDDSAYKKLLEELKSHQAEFSVPSNKLLYLAVPPAFYHTIFTKLHAHKLHRAHNRTNGWSRILVEKPFGKDCDAAQKLDETLASLFAEEQIYRIDHYLAKEAVQNILSFRFANTLLRGLWSNAHIEHMEITMHEKSDLSDRGAFYDGIGALRDVGQNHLLQLYALLTMDEPRSFDAKHIHTAREKALNELVTYTRSTLRKHLVRAQYQGYTKTKGVAQDSQTETFFQLRAFSKDPAWKRVPLYITAGKALHENRVGVTVYFKDATSKLFDTRSCTTTQNSITLSISPDQRIDITINAKQPGFGYRLETRDLSLDCPEGEDEIADDYQKILLDCIEGDQTLFTTTDEVRAEWKFINSIRRHLDTTSLQTYKKGSAGPRHRIS